MKLVILILFAVGWLSGAQESSAVLTNPFTSQSDRIEGGRIFLSQCASCHGQDGRGAQGTPDLTTGFRRANTDEALYQIIAKGIPGTVMPAFALQGREIWQVLTFIRSLQVRRAGETVKGDATRGAAVFHSQQCAGCHSLNAPDLAQIGKRRTPAELRQSILDPNASVDSEWWRIRGRMRSGEAVSGWRLNEDTHSVQFLDEQGRLRSVRKAQLSSYEIIKTSPMPSFRDRIDAAALEDLIAFLVLGGPK